MLRSLGFAYVLATCWGPRLAAACSDVSFDYSQLWIAERTPEQGGQVATDAAILIRADFESLAGETLANVMRIEVLVGDVVVPGRVDALSRSLARWRADALLPPNTELTVRLWRADEVLEAFQIETGDGPTTPNGLTRRLSRPKRRTLSAQNAAQAAASRPPQTMRPL